MSAFADLSELGRVRIFDGIAARVIGGSGLTFAFVELDPSSVVPEHSHPHEQLGVCLRGSLSFRVCDEEREVGPGATWAIPGGAPHEVRVGPEGAAVVEVWSPRRDDWDGLERRGPARPSWPS